MSSAAVLSLGGGAVIYLPHWLSQHHDGPRAGQESPRLTLPTHRTPPLQPASTGDRPSAPMLMAVAQAPAGPTRQQEEMTALQAEIARLLAMASQLDQELALLEDQGEGPEARMFREETPRDEMLREEIIGGGVRSPAGWIEAKAIRTGGAEEPVLPPQESVISDSLRYQPDVSLGDAPRFGEYADHVPFVGLAPGPEPGPELAQTFPLEGSASPFARAPENSSAGSETAVSPSPSDEQASLSVPSEQHEEGTEAVERPAGMHALPKAEPAQALLSKTPQPEEGFRASPGGASGDLSGPGHATQVKPEVALFDGWQEEISSEPPLRPERTTPALDPKASAEPTSVPQAGASPPGAAEGVEQEAPQAEAPAPIGGLPPPAASAVSPPDDSPAADLEAAHPSAGKVETVTPAPSLPSHPALSQSSFSVEEKAVLLKQAEEKLALGDIAAARLLYQQAAEAGSSQAAAALSRTYQADFLKGLGAGGIPFDPLLALVWARRAEALAKAEPAAEPLPAAPPQFAEDSPPQPPTRRAAPASAMTPAPAPGAASALVSAPEAARTSAPAPAAATAAPPRSRPAGSPERLEAVIRRADEMLALRDISAARRLYAYAAEAGSGKSAAALGQTYDPAFLDRIGAQGIRPDPALAAQWYRQALSLGETQVAPALSRLERR